MKCRFARLRWLFSPRLGGWSGAIAGILRWRRAGKLRKLEQTLSADCDEKSESSTGGVLPVRGPPVSSLMLCNSLSFAHSVKRPLIDVVKASQPPSLADRCRRRAARLLPFGPERAQQKYTTPLFIPLDPLHDFLPRGT